MKFNVIGIFVFEYLFIIIYVSAIPMRIIEKIDYYVELTKPNDFNWVDLSIATKLK